MNNGLDYSANVTAKPYRFMFRNQMGDLFTGFLLPSTAKFFSGKKKKFLSLLHPSIEKERDGKAAWVV